MNRTRVRKIVRALINEALIKETVGDPVIQGVLETIIKSDDIGVEITYKASNLVDLTVVRYNEKKTLTDEDLAGDLSFSMSPVANKQVLSRLELLKSKRNGPCLDAWEVSLAFTYDPGKKWGRFLYDVAMEKLNLVMSDRDNVSKFARPIWSNIRSRGDVDRVQLDDLYNTLTPETDEDNCNIAPWGVIAIPGKDFDHDPGYRESEEYINRLRTGDLSAAYAKKGGETPVIDALIRANKLKEVGP